MNVSIDRAEQRVMDLESLGAECRAEAARATRATEQLKLELEQVTNPLELTSQDRVILPSEYTVDDAGFVVVAGRRVLGQWCQGRGGVFVSARTSFSIACRKCAKHYDESRIALFGRWESALDRTFYWWGLAPDLDRSTVLCAEHA